MAFGIWHLARVTLTPICNVSPHFIAVRDSGIFSTLGQLSSKLLGFIISIMHSWAEASLPVMSYGVMRKCELAVVAGSCASVEI
jgi:hypothetical protein